MYKGKKLNIVTDFIKEYISINNLKHGDKLPTENEIINATGVSRVTLRRAFSNMQEQNQIFSIQGSGYYLGDSIKNKEDITIPIIISYNQENSKILNLVGGAQKRLDSYKCNSTVHISRRDPVTEREMLQELFDSGCRCAIIFPVSSEDNTDFYFSLIQKGMNLVFIDRQPQGIYCCNLVQADNMTGGYLATKHLIEQGHRNIAVFGLDPLVHTSTIGERYAGYKQALREFGIDLPHKSYYYSKYRICNSDVEELLSPHCNITAVFAISDHAAVDIATHAYNKNLNVPNDLAVIGFDNLDITTLFTPHLSTIDQPFTQLGEEAAEIAYNIISGSSNGYTQKILPVRLIQRESTIK